MIHALATPDPLALPALIAAAGPRACFRFVEFFTAHIRNPNTRQAYAHAVARFLEWCHGRGWRLEDLHPIRVAAYVESLERDCGFARPSVKQHLAAIRMLFDYLVTGGILPMNPAASVRGPKYSIQRGKTPVLTAQQARQLLDSIDPASLAGLRDRALIGVMIYTFARVSAAVQLRLEDYFPSGKRWRLRLREKAGRACELFVHHNAEAYLDAYLRVAAIEGRKSPLFPSFNRCGQLSTNPMHRTDALRMVQRRARAAGIDTPVCNHSFRATGITEYLRNGGKLEIAQQMANHQSSRTTSLYDRRNDEISLDEIERILI